MFGNKRDRRDDKRDSVSARAANLVIGCRSDPFQRSDAALIADRQSSPGRFKRGNHRGGGRFDMVGIGVSGLHDLFGSPCAVSNRRGGLSSASSRIERRPDRARRQLR